MERVQQWILGAMLVMAVLNCQAVEVQQGVLYQGGTLIESQQLGVAFKIPRGWQGAWPNGSAFFVLESSELQANLFMTFDQIGKQQLQQMMSQNIPLDTGMLLQPLAKPTTRQALLQGEYQVVGAPSPMHAMVVGKELRKNFSVAVIALTYTVNPQVNTITANIVNSIELRKTNSAPQTATTAGGKGSWQEYMRGRYIARYYTGSGYSEKQELWLCSDGTFYSSFNSGGYSMNGASGATQSGGRGHWKATGSTTGTGTLILQFGAGKVVQGSAPGFDWTETSAGGERWTFQLSLNGKLYLDNTQWLRGNNEYCR